MSKVNKYQVSKAREERTHQISSPFTQAGVAKNFDWEGPKIEKSCNLSLVAFIDNVITTTSLK